MKLSNKNFREVIETPFLVATRINVHNETHSKKLIEFLSDLGLSISCNKVMRIKNNIGNSELKSKLLNHGVFVFLNIQPSIPLHFAIDYIGFKIDTPHRKPEFHGTTLVVFLKKKQTKKNKKQNKKPRANTQQGQP